MEEPGPLSYAVTGSPLGEIVVAWSPAGLRRLWFVGGDAAWAPPADWRCQRDAAFGAGLQLEAYFAGRLARFDLPLDARGTDFQRRVWEELRRIPFGHTATYGQVAERLGRSGAARAVGGANHRNPLAVVVPCHRVVGADGSLTGYAGGLRFKQFLLDLERRTADRLAA